MERTEVSEGTLNRLETAKYHLHVLAGAVDDEEGKHPSFLGGFIRAAAALLQHVCVLVEKRGGSDEGQITE